MNPVEDVTVLMDKLGKYSSDVCKIIYRYTLELKCYELWPTTKEFRKQLRRVVQPCVACGVRDDFINYLCIDCHVRTYHPHKSLVDALKNIPQRVRTLAFKSYTKEKALRLVEYYHFAADLIAWDRMLEGIYVRKIPIFLMRIGDKWIYFKYTSVVNDFYSKAKELRKSFVNTQNLLTGLHWGLYSPRSRLVGVANSDRDYSSAKYRAHACYCLDSLEAGDTQNNLTTIHGCSRPKIFKAYKLLKLKYEYEVDQLRGSRTPKKYKSLDLRHVFP